MISVKVKKSRSAVLAVLLLLLTVSCVVRTGGTPIFSHSVPKAELGSKLYTVIIYSTPEINYLKTVAFLDPEGDGYELVPFGATFNYSVTRGVQADEAFEMARKAVSDHSAFRTLEVRAIRLADGTVAGYELRPLYQPFVYGESDVLETSYVLRPGGRITVYVNLKDSIERRLERDDRHSDR